jgi:AraC-like DNA-binding protein
MKNPVTVPDDDFLQNLNLAIERHLSDSHLGVSKLLRIVGMSRTDLHRKLERTVGMSATRYFRYVRLQRAADLLRQQPQSSISDIAFEVGFNSQSYFTRKFKAMFGCCPEHWKKHEPASTAFEQLRNTQADFLTIKHKIS